MRNVNAFPWKLTIAMLACCAINFAAWAFVVPVFESPDEPHHWKNAQYIHSHLALPPYTPDYLEAPQAPFYYILISPLASPMDPPPILKSQDTESDLGFHFKNMPAIAIESRCPPHFFRNCPGDAAQYLPIRAARLATTLFGLLSILFTAFSAFELTGDKWVTVMAAGIIGFLPQFAFRTASVNNDAALVCFSAAAIYSIIRLSRRGFELVPALIGAVMLALAFLSKVSAAVLVPLFAVAVLMTGGPLLARIKRLIATLSVSALLVLPWLVRNLITYGDLFGEKKMGQMVPMMLVRRSLADPYFRHAFPRLVGQSFFGYFGWMNVVMPGWVYKAYAAAAMIAAAGLIIYAVQRRVLIPPILFLVASGALSIAFLLYASLNYPQPQGRLLFECLSAVAVLAAAGYGSIRYARGIIAGLVIAGALSANLYALTRVIHRAYWGSPPTQIRTTTLLARAGTQPLVADGRNSSYSQTFIAERDFLTAVDLPLSQLGASHNGKAYTQVSIAESAQSAPLAVAKIPNANPGDEMRYAHLEFPAVEGSSGKRFFIYVTETEHAGLSNAIVSVRGGMAFQELPMSTNEVPIRTSYVAPCWTCP